jgi:tetratricopeptide (TPR) repeat protein
LQGAIIPLANFFDDRALFQEGIALFEEAIATIEQEAETQVLGHLHIAHAKLLRHSASYSRVRDHLSRGLALLSDEAVDLEAKVEGLLVLAYLDSMIGLSESAVQHGQKALALAEATKQERLIALALLDLGIREGDRGESQASIRYYRLAQNHFQTLGDGKHVAICLVSIAIQTLYEGHYEDALELLTEMLGSVREQGLFYYEQHVLKFCAEACFMLGRFDEAKQFLEEALLKARSSKFTYQEAWLEILKARLLIQQGSLTQIRPLLEQVLRLAWKDDIQMTLYAFIVWAKYDIAQGQKDRAAQLLQAAISHPATISYQRQYAQELLAKLEAPAKPSIPLDELIEGLLSDSN